MVVFNVVVVAIFNMLLYYCNTSQLVICP